MCAVYEREETGNHNIERERGRERRAERAMSAEREVQPVCSVCSVCRCERQQLHVESLNECIRSETLV